MSAEHDQLKKMLLRELRASWKRYAAQFGAVTMQHDALSRSVSRIVQTLYSTKKEERMIRSTRFLALLVEDVAAGRARVTAAQSELNRRFRKFEAAASRIENAVGGETDVEQ